MDKIKLYEICDERHIIIVSTENTIFYCEILDDLSIQYEELTNLSNLVQILKYSKNSYLFITLNQIFSILLDEDSFVNNFDIQVNYTFHQAINIPKNGIAVIADDSLILIFDIFIDKISLKVKIDLNYNSLLSLYYIKETNELLIRGYDQIFFVDLKKYSINYIIKEINCFIWNDYNVIMGKHPMDNNFCMINDHLLAMSFSRNVITLIDIDKHIIIKNFIDSHDNITSLIKPDNFVENSFLCGIYCYDCHGGKYYYFAKGKIIEYDHKKDDDFYNFDVELTKKKLPGFPVSIKLLRNDIILILFSDDKKYTNNSISFKLNIFKFNEIF